MRPPLATAVQDINVGVPPAGLGVQDFGMSRTIGYKISYVFGDMNTALGWGGWGGGGGRTSGFWFLQKVEDPAPSLKTYCFSSSQYHLERLGKPGGGKITWCMADVRRNFSSLTSPALAGPLNQQLAHILAGPWEVRAQNALYIYIYV